jgi:pilus assembly protein Flp/PilA
MAMKSPTEKLLGFLASEEGPTTVEYAIMLGLIVLACFAAVSAVGTTSSTVFRTVTTEGLSQ